MKKILTGYLVTERTGHPKLKAVHKLIFRDEDGNHYTLRCSSEYPGGIPEGARYMGEITVEWADDRDTDRKM